MQANTSTGTSAMRSARKAELSLTRCRVADRAAGSAKGGIGYWSTSAR